MDGYMRCDAMGGEWEGSGEFGCLNVLVGYYLGTRTDGG